MLRHLSVSLLNLASIVILGETVGSHAGPMTSLRPGEMSAFFSSLVHDNHVNLKDPGDPTVKNTKYGLGACSRYVACVTPLCQ